MALHWNLTDIENHEELCWDTRKLSDLAPEEKRHYRLDEEAGTATRMNAITESLIFITMGVGMGEITEANWQEFAHRVALSQLLNGPYLTAWDGDEVRGQYITDDDVKAHIGLKCNVGQEPWRKWVTRQTPTIKTGGYRLREWTARVNINEALEEERVGLRRMLRQLVAHAALHTSNGATDADQEFLDDNGGNEITNELIDSMRECLKRTK